MGLGRGLAAFALVLLGEDVSGPGVHAAVVVSDLQVFQRILDPLFQAFFANAILDPIERMNGFHLTGFIGLVTGLLGDAFHNFLGTLVVLQIVFGLLQIVIAAVAGRHHHVVAHLVGGNRHDARRQIGLHLGVDVLDLHRAAAVPVLHLV